MLTNIDEIKLKLKLLIDSKTPKQSCFSSILVDFANDTFKVNSNDLSLIHSILHTVFNKKGKKFGLDIVKLHDKCIHAMSNQGMKHNEIDKLDCF